MTDNCHGRQKLYVVLGVAATQEGEMEVFLFGILFALGPSVAVVAWLIWYSGAFGNSARDRRQEPWTG